MAHKYKIGDSFEIFFAGHNYYPTITNLLPSDNSYQAGPGWTVTEEFLDKGILKSQSKPVIKIKLKLHETS